MAADAPHVLIAFARQILVADHHVVDVSRFVGQMVEAALVAANAEKGVMVDITVAAVEAIERADDVAFLPGIELIRTAEAEHLAVPAERLLEVFRHHDEVAEPLDVRGALLDAEQLALAAVFIVARIDRGSRHLDRLEHCHAVHNLDLVAVGVGQPRPLAAARLVDILDFRGSLDPRHPLEVLVARRVDGDADIARLTQFGDVDVVGWIASAHVERIFGPVRPNHAEIGQELLLLVEIGRANPPISEIEGFDHRHEQPPSRKTCRISLEHFSVPGESPSTADPRSHRGGPGGRTQELAEECKMSSLEEYAGKYQTARLERHNGILQVTLYTEGQSLRWGFLPHGE